MVRFRLKSIILLAMCSVAGLEAAAEPDPTVYPLQDIVVASSARREGPIVWNMPITAGPALLLSGENMRDRQLYTVEDIFRMSPGVYVRSQFTGTSQARMIVRGFGVAGTPPTHGIRLLLDGMPMTFPDGHFLPQNIDYRTIEAVEVYRGSAYLPASAGALAGAVNYRSFTAATSPGLRLRAEAGSYANVRWHAACSSSQEASDFTVAATHASQDGYRPLNSEEADFLSGTVGRRLNDSATLRVFALYSRVDGDLAGPISMNQFDVNPASVNPPGVSPNVTRDQPFRELEVSRIGANLHIAGARSVTDINTWLLYSDYQVFRPRATEGLAFESTAPGLSVRHGWDTMAAGLQHHFDVSGELFAEWRPTKRRQLNAGEKGAVQSDHDERAGLATLALADTIAFGPNWSLALTIMPEYHWRKVDETFNNAPAPVALDEDFFYPSGRAQLNWAHSAELGFWTAVSANFEPPILDDLVGSSASATQVNGTTVKRLNGARLTVLEAQEAVTGEVGGRGRLGRVSWDVTLYHARVTDEIIRTRPPEGPDATQNAAGPTIHQGIESALGLDLASRTRNAPFDLSWYTVVNVNDFRFEDDPDFGDNRLPAVPPVFVQSELLARLREGWFCAAGIEWAPEGMYVDFANTLETDGYAVAHVRAGRKVSEGISCFASLENVFDTEFVNSVAPQSGLNGTVNEQTSALFPGQDRRWQVGVEWAF
jgi:iron complex outermembrane receptor protein